MLVDVDDTIIRVHGYAKHGAGFGYTRVRGLNALLATATTPGSAPVIVAQRLRKGSAASPRGAARLVADASATVRAMTTATPLVRADSAYYGHATVAAALRAGAQVSVTVLTRHPRFSASSVIGNAPAPSRPTPSGQKVRTWSASTDQSASSSMLDRGASSMRCSLVSPRASRQVPQQATCPP